MKKKKESIFKQEVRRDIGTFFRLHGKERWVFVWDYFRYKIIAAAFALFVIVLFAVMLWQGQKPYRLRVCVVLNNDQYCDAWFNRFEKELKSDGQKGDLDLNQDQPFDYDNMYYNVQELEVMTTISSYRMDVAICGPDMYSYLLALDVCQDLREVFTAEEIASWQQEGILTEGTAGITINPDGSENMDDATQGIFALNLSDRNFGQEYNQGQVLEEGEDMAPLYAIIINNTSHMEDCKKLLKEISK